MITVAILVNGNPIMSRSATNTGKVNNGKGVYAVDDGTEIEHEYKAGCVPLAIKLLETLRPYHDGETE